MDATPLLSKLLKAMRENRLEAILIGNAAAAMHGAPVTTLDFDFMFRDTPPNVRKLKSMTRALGGTLFRPFYPVSKLYRLMAEDIGMQADFMPVIHGIRSFASLRSRAARQKAGGEELILASLPDIIASKRAAGRQCSQSLRKHSMKSKRQTEHKPKSGRPSRSEILEALKKESEADLVDMIRRRLAMPMEKRMNFLRKRLPGGGSCL